MDFIFGYRIDVEHSIFREERVYVRCLQHVGNEKFLDSGF